MRNVLLRGLALPVAAVIFCSVATAATITVDVGTDGSGGAGECELRDALEAADNDTSVDGCAAGDGADLIVFDPGVSLITLASDLPTINETLEIAGHGPDDLVIDGDDSHQIIDAFGVGVDLTIRELQLFRGNSASMAGCIFTQALDDVVLEDVRVDSCQGAGAFGGGAQLYSEEAGSRVDFNRVYFTGNSGVAGGGAAIVAESGTITDSAFVDNTANESGGIGGAVIMGRSLHLTVSRSTFWGNQAHTRGSAITTILASQTLIIEHSTFSQNAITSNANVRGGAIYNNGTTSLFNSVVAANTEASNLHSRADVVDDTGGLSTLGYNFIGNNDGASAVFPAGVQPNGDQAGTPGDPLDPGLGPLQNNGGPTLSSLPDAVSDLVDQGSCPGEIEDQRGFNNTDTGLRPVPAGGGIMPADDGCDVGAVERLATPSDTLVRDGFESPGVP